MSTCMTIGRLRCSVFTVLATILVYSTQLVGQDLREMMAPFQLRYAIIPGGDDPLGQGVVGSFPFPGHTGYAELANDPGPDGLGATARFIMGASGSKVIRIEGNIVHTSENQWLTQRFLEGVRGKFTLVHEQDLIPLFGTLYRVVRIRPRNDARPTEIHLQRVSEDQWPPGVQLDPYAYTISDAGELWSGFGVHNEWLVTCKYDSAQKRFVLSIPKYEYDPRNGAVGRRLSEENTAVAGELLMIRCATDIIRFRVVSVVLPDPEHHIPGWVELRKLWPKIVPYGIEQDIQLLIAP